MKPASARGSNGNSRRISRDLAGVDVFRLQLRQRRRVEMRAMRAGHRGIFDDRHLGVGLAESTFRASAPGSQQLGHVDRALRLPAPRPGLAGSAGAAGVAGVRRLRFRALASSPESLQAASSAPPPERRAATARTCLRGKERIMRITWTNGWILQCRRHQKARVGAN